MMASTRTRKDTVDDDESVLDISEQTFRPPDVALHQQRVLAWNPILDPGWVIVALFCIGVIMMPVGFKMNSLQSSAVEIIQKYDGYYESNPLCGINETYNAKRVCNLNFTAPQDMSPPVLIYYQLENFYQNYRTYFQSFDPFQLAGQVGGQDPVSKDKCEPLNQLGNMTLNPCGLVANTFFNDYFTLLSGNSTNGEPLVMIEEGIAFESDVRYKFKQPEGFHYAPCPDNICNETCCEGPDWSCKMPYKDEDENCYAYFYPNDDTTQYLHETYPNVISPLEGVTNEHFIVWMRIATQPTFRKLYGWIDQPIAKGEQLLFQVNANYVVTRFRGSKALIVATSNVFGGKNPYTGPVFIGTAAFFIAAGIFFSLKQLWRPRKIADQAYLHYKQD